MNMDEQELLTAGQGSAPIVKLSQIIEKEDDDQTSFRSDSDFGASGMQSHRILMGSHKATDSKVGPSHDNSNGN